MRIAMLLLVLLLTACGKPVPPEKSSYVGLWENENRMYILITQEGSVKYERVEGNASRKVEGPLKGFIGNDFEVGIGPASTKFVVEKPPYQDGGKWKMVVDGVELTRTR